MNALALFKAGNDYLQIAALLHTSEAEVEKEIHRLRNEEKGDTAQQEYEEELRAAAEKTRAYKRQWAHAKKLNAKKLKQSEAPRLIRYAGYEEERA